jgi:hypothetical protein
MGIHEGAGQLAKALKELRLAWSETQSSWDDPISRSFEERYLVPLDPDAKKAMEAMGAMAVLLEQARRDCT